MLSFNKGNVTISCSNTLPVSSLRIFFAWMSSPINKPELCARREFHSIRPVRIKVSFSFCHFRKPLCYIMYILFSHFPVRHWPTQLGDQLLFSTPNFIRKTLRKQQHQVPTALYNCLPFCHVLDLTGESVLVNYEYVHQNTFAHRDYDRSQLFMITAE